MKYRSFLIASIVGLLLPVGVWGQDTMYVCRDGRYTPMPIAQIDSIVFARPTGDGMELDRGTSWLYDITFTQSTPMTEYANMDATVASLSAQGLVVKGTKKDLQFNRYYSLADRTALFECKFSINTVARFSTNERAPIFYVDMKAKEIRVNSVAKKVTFLTATHWYKVEVRKNYQDQSIKLTDLTTGDWELLTVRQDGEGGVSQGSVNSTPNYPGMQHDYYTMGLEAGNLYTIRRFAVYTGYAQVGVLLYGNSISEPEGYFPAADFDKAWTQLIVKRVKSGAIASGRGGTQIWQVLDRIKNELPYIRAKYVMVTIGTNGGNTVENLSQLVEYIRSQGAIPLLNHIPCNESGTQVAVNAMIDQVRATYGIKGCNFDLPTSLAGDGREVDTSMMWWEDYEPYNWFSHDYYHHPNVKGSQAMYEQTLVDIPEIYE